MKRTKRGDWTTDRLAQAAVGLEAELSLIVDDAVVDPEGLFGDPRGFIHEPLIHRIGTSYHLPNGAVVYFDTGVIEIATPVIELERGSVRRAARSLWEGIYDIHGHLDRWARDHDKRLRLQGFSTHYNVSVRHGDRAASRRTVEQLARALVYVLPVPVMMLGTNRRSTGVGVRPRAGRIEVTADFTPHAPLMIAAGSFVAGVVREASTWSAPAVRALPSRVPVIRPFAPIRHTSRRGWLANIGCYDQSPFACDIDAPAWTTTRGTRSLRSIGHRIFRRFARSIGRVADRPTFDLLRSIFDGSAATLLSLDDRPPSYDDVGRDTSWDAAAPASLGRSRYERVVRNAIQRRPLRLAGDVCTPRGIRGWSRVVFRRDHDGAQVVVPFDALVDRLGEWERD